MIHTPLKWSTHNVHNDDLSINATLGSNVYTLTLDAALKVQTKSTFDPLDADLSKSKRQLLSFISKPLIHVSMVLRAFDSPPAGGIQNGPPSGQRFAGWLIRC